LLELDELRLDARAGFVCFEQLCAVLLLRGRQRAVPGQRLLLPHARDLGLGLAAQGGVRTRLLLELQRRLTLARNQQIAVGGKLLPQLSRLATGSVQLALQHLLALARAHALARAVQTCSSNPRHSSIAN
jgi:hypothetical protein